MYILNNYAMLQAGVKTTKPSVRDGFVVMRLYSSHFGTPKKCFLNCGV
jgi:hypothetical protein